MSETTIGEYVRYETDATVFATDAAATAEERALKETADIVRRMLNRSYPLMRDLTAQRGKNNSRLSSESRELSDIAYAVLGFKRHQYDAELLKQRQKGPNSAELIASATMNASDEMSSAIENASRTTRRVAGRGAGLLLVTFVTFWSALVA